MNKQEFLEQLKDPIAAGVDQAAKDFQKRWEGFIDVFNIRETQQVMRGRERRVWDVQIFSTDELLLKSFEITFKDYVCKYNKGAMFHIGNYGRETNCFAIAILI